MTKKMINYDVWHSWCQWGLAFSVLMGGICTYGVYYFGDKKSPKPVVTLVPTPPSLNINPEKEVVNIKGNENIVVQGNKNKVYRDKVENNNDNSNNKTGNSFNGTNHGTVNQNQQIYNYNVAPADRVLTQELKNRLNQIPGNYQIILDVENGSTESNKFGGEVYASSM